MQRVRPSRIFRIGFHFLLRLSLCLSLIPTLNPINAQRRPQGRLSRESRMPRPSPSINPFTAIEREMARGNSSTINFRRTNLDQKAEGTAQVSVRDQTLLVRMHARNMPLPTRFNQRRYTLWAYLPNYNQRVYLGDLPILTKRGRRTRARRVNVPDERGESESAFRFTALPHGAVFGGLVLSAEPPRYVPMPINTAQPLLVALTPEGEADNRIASTLNATGSVPPPVPAAHTERVTAQKTVKSNSTRQARPNTRGRTRPARRRSGKKS